jgi:hypothetical protein
VVGKSVVWSSKALTVVLGALRDDDHIARLDLLLLASYDRLANPRGENEVLVDLVHLHVLAIPPIARSMRVRG